ncbi:MAG: lamin tail domain-containing protein [Candidatus Eisenbacteria bacterium]
MTRLFEGTRRFARRWLTPVLALACLVPVARAADIDQIYLNEATVRGLERIELYNRAANVINLSGWSIVGSNGTFTLPPGSFIGAHAYRVFSTPGDHLGDIGGEIILLDLVGHGGDRVFYGNQGSAPLPHDNPDVSLARAPDAAWNPARDPGPAGSGLWWTLDFTSSFGQLNDAKVPLPGGSLEINEVSPKLPPLAGVGDFVELYNPTAAPISTTGWIVSVGTGMETLLGGVVPPGGVVFFGLIPGTFSDTAKLVYLFDADTVRVDQVGWTTGPPAEGACYERCPDGAGPNLGYDWVTTGGAITWFLSPCTLGLLNVPTLLRPASATRRSSSRVGASSRIATAPGGCSSNSMAV